MAYILPPPLPHPSLFKNGKEYRLWAEKNRQEREKIKKEEILCGLKWKRRFLLLSKKKYERERFLLYL